MAQPQSSLRNRESRRSAERTAVLVPASLTSGVCHSNATLLNIAPGGAMLESLAELGASSRVVVRCGTVIASAMIVWRKGDRVGVSFEVPLADAQITEQLLRNEALAVRLRLYHESVIAANWKRLRTGSARSE